MQNASSFVVIGFVALVCGTSAFGAELANRATSSTVTIDQTRSNSDARTEVVVKTLIDEPPIQIENVSLETAPAPAPQPSALLKFDVSNETAVRITDIMMRVSFVEKRPDSSDTPPKAVVGPVTVRVGQTLQAGYVLSYEMLFRNLSSDCNCSPLVEILSARSLPD